MKDKKFSENVIGNYQDSERYYKNETFKAYIKDILEYCTMEYYRGRERIIVLEGIMGRGQKFTKSNKYMKEIHMLGNYLVIKKV